MEHGATRAGRGFTLLEILLAIALTLALASGVFAFMNNLMLRRDQAMVFVAQAQASGAIIERLESDLFTAMVVGGEQGGIVGSAERIRVLSRGVTPPMLGDLTSVPLGDLQGCEFTFDAASKQLRGSRFEAGVTPTFEPIARIDRLRFRYHDGRRWSNSFDSAQEGRLPAAIEIAIWFSTEAQAQLPSELEATLSEEDLRDPVLEMLLEEERERARRKAQAEALQQEDQPLPEPDRLRVIVVPDGPIPARGGT